MAGLAVNVGDLPCAADGTDALSVASSGLEAASRGRVTDRIVDSSGRSQIDDALMRRLVALRQLLRPCETLLVADAMTRQQSDNIAQGFHRPLGITGLIPTKMDGDARGGAAISMGDVTGVPIRFIGVGSGIEALEVFEPGGLAAHLGDGRCPGLIERGESMVSGQLAEAQAGRMLKGEFTLEDSDEQLSQERGMGSIGQLLERMPGGLSSAAATTDSHSARHQLDHALEIIRSMTAVERRRPGILDAVRRRRIAQVSGTNEQQANQTVQQFRQVRALKKSLGRVGGPARGRKLPWQTGRWGWGPT